MKLTLANSYKRAKTPGATKADVIVRVGRRVVQVERKDTSVRSIVPIAAADEGDICSIYLP